MFGECFDILYLYIIYIHLAMGLGIILQMKVYFSRDSLLQAPYLSESIRGWLLKRSSEADTLLLAESENYRLQLGVSVRADAAENGALLSKTGTRILPQDTAGVGDARRYRRDHNTQGAKLSLMRKVVLLFIVMEITKYMNCLYSFP